jgi:hypothetical protein
MSESQENNQVQVSDDLKNILAILKPNDAQEILRLKDELADNWNKKQIFRTETEMRVSVLNDGKFPTPAAKYWQSVREMSAHFDALMNLSFDMRRSNVERLKLEKKMKAAEEEGDQLEIMSLQIELDQNLYNKACMEQVAHDRVREIQTWSKLKSELDDGTFDTQEVNTHQAESLHHRLAFRASALNEHSDPTEVANVVGQLQTMERLKKQNALTHEQVIAQKQLQNKQ